MTLTINDVPVASMSDDDIGAWLDRRSNGYCIRGSTRNLWVNVLRVFDDVGTPVTVRQMFYRLVSIGQIQKEEAAYKMVARQLLKMRRKGLIPYDWIADGTRWMRKPKTHSSVDSMLRAGAESYRRSVWLDQPHYVEIWLEKDALAGVCLPVTEEYDVPLMVTRGFSSETFLYAASEEMKAKDGQRPGVPRLLLRRPRPVGRGRW